MDGMIRRLAAALALTIALPAVAAQPIAGRWVTASGSAVVEIARCGKAMCGRIVRVLKVPADADGAAKARQAVGATILSGFVADGDGWKGNAVNPKTGQTYAARLTRDGATLKVYGCVAVFCKTVVWTAAR